mmetsp:Transcript_69309/g.202918  ORF Transcript_69309/g.202918 Transcript_69309/m.202918 type:complete len:395 (+) Transcript_69309:554-1738(+)
MAARLLPLLQEDLRDLSIFGELRLQCHLIDAVGQRPDKDLPWALLYCRGGIRASIGCCSWCHPVELVWIVSLSPKHALVPSNGHLARAVCAGEHQYPVAVILGTLGLLVRFECDEGPLAVCLATSLHEDVNDRSILGELRPQRHVRDVVRKGADEDLLRRLRHAGHRHAGAVHGSVLRCACQRVLPKHALVASKRDLTGLVRARELQHAIGHLSSLRGLLMVGECHECPLTAWLTVRLDEYVLNGSIPHELCPDSLVHYSVWKRTHEDLPGSGPSSSGHSPRLVSAIAIGRLVGASTISRPSTLALVLSQHHVAGLVTAREDEGSVAALLCHHGLLMRSELDHGPLAARLAARLHEDLFHFSVLGELHSEQVLRDVARQRAHKHLAARHAALLD